MVSSVDGLAGAVAVGSSAPPQRRDVASEAVTGVWGRAGPRLYVTGWLATSLRLAYDVARKRRHLAPAAVVHMALSPIASDHRYPSFAQGIGGGLWSIGQPGQVEVNS